VVRVLDQSPQAASGASSLPAGLFGPLESADDNLVSQIVRAGVERTLAHARSLLRPGLEWSDGGVLNLKPGSAPRLVQPAGWIRPAALVAAWLKHPNIVFEGRCRVDHLLDLAPPGSAQLVVLAAAHACEGMVRNTWARDARLATQIALPPDTQALAGQISWGPMPPQGASAAQGLAASLPALPVNGRGHLVCGIPMLPGQAPGWLTGAGFEEPQALSDVQALHRSNFERLHSLLPGAASALQGEWQAGRVQAWQGVRCVGRTRLPVVRRLSAPSHPVDIWVCTALGSRGLSWAALCGELLAAAVGGAALPLPQPLARQIMGKAAVPIRRPRTSGL
jgi:tRNA 5-methylaminomethyl-2-thiouridine biosynthesis bifunctional protein